MKLHEIILAAVALLLIGAALRWQYSSTIGKATGGDDAYAFPVSTPFTSPFCSPGAGNCRIDLDPDPYPYEGIEPYIANPNR
jgi:hypothetical protein